MIKRVRQLAVVSLLVTLATATPTEAAPKHPVKPLTVDEENLSNLNQWMPKTFARWQDQLPAEFNTPNLKWLTKLDGVTSGLRPMVLDGHKTLVGGVRQPGWCVNDVEVVIAPDHISGVVFFEHKSCSGDGFRGRSQLSRAGLPLAPSQGCKRFLLRITAAQVG